ncbi:hypothetical protein VTN96DRAFT_9722 [Rasamsonia emersonii]
MKADENKNLWILDSMAFEDGLPSDLKRKNGITPMLVYATSPRSSRWPKAQFSMKDTTLIMNPWSKWETELLVSLESRKMNQAIT